MNLVNIDLVSEPLQEGDYNFIADTNYPVCLLGFQLKNSYDQTRLQMKSEYGIKDYLHLLPNAEASPTVFRGLMFKSKTIFTTLFNQLENSNLLQTELPIRRYQNILSEYNLTCNNCYAYLQKGIYPIDGECIDTISKNKINLNDLYVNAFNNEHVPAFQSCAYFTIFILSNRSIFRHGTDVLISKFIKKDTV